MMRKIVVIPGEIFCIPLFMSKDDWKLKMKLSNEDLNKEFAFGREHPKWSGSQEFEVPGLDNNHRILKYDGIDLKGVSYTKYAYTTDHYKKVHSDWSKLKYN
jgi:hypothetical protein